MSSHRDVHGLNGAQDVPGTVLLEEKRDNKDHIVLQPVPTDDPDDPLNWSAWRKSVNFGLSCTFVTLTFVLLDNAYVAYEPYSEELGMTYESYNYSIAANYAGLAIGSIFFIPFVHRYGRRPLYLMSNSIQLAIAIWAAYMKTPGEVIANSLVGGVGGAISETIAMITIADIYFLHHHALMSGIFLMMQAVGAFIGPVVMGYAVNNVGWRWMWKITAIMIAVNLLASFLFFEESKYIPHSDGRPMHHQNIQEPTIGMAVKDPQDQAYDLRTVSTSPGISYPPKSYRQRLALSTPTDEPVLRHFIQPFMILFAIPGVLYASVTYGTLLAWMSMMTSSLSYYTLLPPYNLNPSQVGLLSLGPFVGLAIGSIIFPYASDWSIIRLAKRNKGIFEPEMRLWPAIGGAVISFAGILVFGYCLGDGEVLINSLVGYAIFCVGWVICADASLTYVLDCYHEIIGDAMVAIVFCRNGISLIVLFIYTPWIEHLGIKNTYLLVAFLALAVLLAAPIIFLFLGKRIRQATASAFRHYAGLQARVRS